MSKIYLQSLTLREFRSFSEITIDLPPGPGVMIVHGTIGLGKSSLFDGMEWALTGEIDHFREAGKGADSADYLRRWNASPARPTEITMQFSDQGVVFRSLTSNFASTVAVTDISEYLRAATWKQKIGNLHRYLLLTHFLGQSSLSRMTHRKPEERWEFLQEPAQSDRATTLATALHGHGSSTAARAYEKRSAAFMADVQALESLLVQENRQWEVLRTEGGIDNATIVEQALEIIEQLSPAIAMLGEIERPTPKTTADELIDSLLRIDENLPGQFAARRVALARAHDVAAQHQIFILECTAQASVLETANKDDEARESLLTAAKERADELVTAAGAIEQKFSNARNRLTELLGLQNRHGQIAQLVNDLSSTEAQIDLLGTRVSKAANDVLLEERKRTIIGRLESEVGGASASIERILNQLSKLSEIDKLDQFLMDAGSQLEALNLQEATLITQVGTVQAELRLKEENSRRKSDELEAFRTSIDRISAAVAQISASLPQDSCICPVCTTEFPSPSALWKQVQSVASTLSPALAVLEKSFSDAKAEEAAFKRSLDSLVFALDGNRTSVRTILAIRTKRDDLNADFLNDSDFKLQSPDECRRILTAQLSRYGWVRARRSYWIRHPVFDGSNNGLIAWSQAVQRRNELEAERQDQIRRLSIIDRALREAQALFAADFDRLLTAGTGSDNAIESSIVEMEKQSEEMAAELRMAEEAMRLAKNQALALEIDLIENRARIKQLHARHSAAQATADVLVKEWVRLGFSQGLIGQQYLQNAEQSLTRLASDYAQIKPRIYRLRDGKVIWSQNENHRLLIEELRLKTGSAPSEVRDKIREKAIQMQSELTGKAASFLRAKSIAQISYAEVSAKVLSFNRDYLKPLSHLMGKINRAILSEPHIGLDLKIVKRKIEQRAVKAAGLAEQVSKLDPQLVHSEGQMAALAVSMLCAANLTFQWSRWPALILDDPLQHNDVIHASAFADMLCNLVSAKGYQIFLSTHDLAQAEFLRRKFSASNVPCTMIHLRGRGGSSLDTDIKLYDGVESLASEQLATQHS